MIRIGSLAAGGIAIIAAQPAAAQEVSTALSVYAWGTQVNQEMQSGAEVEIDAKTLLENLDMALMGAVVHRRGDWIFGFEGVYADVGKKDDPTFSIDQGEPDPTEIDAVAEFETKTTIINAFAGYRIPTDPRLELYGTAGLRWTRFETTMTVDADGASFRMETEDDMTDGTLGLWGSYNINESWSLPFVLDVGGGDSALTWQAMLGATWHRGPHGVTLGYRHIYWDISPESKTVDTVTYGGPLLAYTYTF
jgi:hypothetical protein